MGVKLNLREKEKSCQGRCVTDDMGPGWDTVLAGGEREG